MKFIHCADFHLCTAFTSSSLPADVLSEHRKAMLDTFLKVVKTADDEKVDALLISGDLIDERYAGALDMRRISDAFASIPNIRVFIACGNHDPITYNSYYMTYDFPKNVTIFPNELTCIDIPELNADIYGYSWQRNRYDMIPFDMPKTNKDKINILCLHCDCTGSGTYMPANADRLNDAGFDYVALGHIHKPMRVKERVYYPGSCEPLDFSETGQHGFILGEIDPQTKITFAKFVSCATKHFESVHFDLTRMDNYNEIEGMLKRVLPQDKNAVVRVIFEGSKNSDISLEQVISDLAPGFYSLTFKDLTSADFNIEKLYDENENNIIGKYIASLVKQAKTNETADIALYSGIEALLKNKQ